MLFASRAFSSTTTTSVSKTRPQVLRKGKKKKRFTPPPPLPVELIDQVFRLVVLNDPHTASKLVRLNRYWNARLIPFLYKSVVLGSSGAIHAFAAHVSRANRAHIIDLAIMPPGPFPDLYSMEDQLEGVGLSGCSNIRTLALGGSFCTDDPRLNTLRPTHLYMAYTPSLDCDIVHPFSFEVTHIDVQCLLSCPFSLLSILEVFASVTHLSICIDFFGAIEYWARVFPAIVQEILGHNITLRISLALMKPYSGNALDEFRQFIDPNSALPNLHLEICNNYDQISFDLLNWKIDMQERHSRASE